MITDEDGKYKKGGIIRYIYLNKILIIIKDNEDKLKSLTEDIIQKTEPKYLYR